MFVRTLYLNKKPNNGFITVQVIKPKYVVDNTNLKLADIFEQQELETDEARRSNVRKTVKND